MRWLIVIAMAFVVGCATMQADSGSARLAVQYGTLKYIKNDTQKASRVAAKVDAALEIVNNNLTTIAALDTAVRDSIEWQSLSIEDKMLLDALLTEVRHEMERRIGDGVLSPEQRVKVADVLRWIRAATTMAGA